MVESEKDGLAPRSPRLYGCIPPWPRPPLPVSNRPLLSIAAELSAPPSEPLCFRDVTLVASIRGYDAVAVVDQWEMRDGYHIWMRRLGLYDYIEDLVAEGDVHAAIEIVGGRGSSLTAYNIGAVIAVLRQCG